MLTSLPPPAVRGALSVTGSVCPADEPFLLGNCTAVGTAEEADWLSATGTNKTFNCYRPRNMTVH